MNWLARLKKAENTPNLEPTKPTKGPFVGFVAPVEGVFAENEASLKEAAVSANSLTHPVSHADELHAARVDLFTRRGLRLKDAEQLAATIVRRPADFDDRRICLECRHLSGNNCSRAAYAGVGRVVQAIVRLPQRCPAFEGVL